MKIIISKCDLNALLFGENTEIVSNGKLEEIQSIPRKHVGKRKPKARSQNQLITYNILLILHIIYYYITYNILRTIIHMLLLWLTLLFTRCKCTGVYSDTQ